MSVCHQLLSSCLYCLRATSLICQEPLFSSSGPFLFNLPRDSLLQLWIFSRASFVSLPSAFLQLLKLSQAFSLICQEPLLSSSGPRRFMLPRDSLLQLWILDFSEGPFPMFKPSSQGLCKVCKPESNMLFALFCVILHGKASARLHSPCSNLLLKSSARFVCLNLICALLCWCDPLRKGIGKASVSSLKLSSQGLCKVCMPESNPFFALFV